MLRLLKRWVKPMVLGLLVAVTIMVSAIVFNLWNASHKATDAYLVLGGSIRREIHMAQLASQAPKPPPILISSGSMDPCIRLLFEQADASLEQVWLEHCAQSTFGNFVYSAPILKQWQARHVTLITSGSHTFRAVALARILLGAQGIWVTPLVIDEAGVPGNQESLLKTSLDITRAVLWAVVAQVYKPTCPRLMPLASVDLEQWRQQGFKCEHQAGIEGS